MPAEILTKEDLISFKTELIEEIKKVISPKVIPAKEWLRSSDVRKMLSISSGTLQNLRISGTLPFTKIGGTIFYAYSDVIKVLDDNKHKA